MRIRLSAGALLCLLLTSCLTPADQASTQQKPSGDHSGVDLTRLSNSRAMPPVLCSNPQSCAMTFRLGNIGYKDGGGAVVSWLNNMTVNFTGDGGHGSVTTDFDLDNRTANVSQESNSVSVSFYGALGQLLKTINVDVDRNHCGHIGHKHLEEAIPDIVHAINSYNLTQSALSANQAGCAAK
jgi:aconitase B